MKDIRKRIISVVLAILMFVTTFMGSNGFSFVAKASVTEAYATSGRVSLSKTLPRFDISESGRPSSEGLWTIRVDGKKVFCLNPGKSMHTGDYVKGKSSDAVNYENQSLAKVTTYYYGTKQQSGGTKLFALCQAYAWAAGKGVNKKKAMEQAAGAVGVQASAAKAIYEEIEATVPYGDVVYYTVSSCRKGGSGSGHQHLIGWYGSPPEPEVLEYTVPYSDKASEDIQLTITKKDTETGKNIDTATFDIYRDNVKVAAVQTTNGVAKYTYKATYSAELEPSDPYYYVENWNSLNSTQQKEMKVKGVYSCEAYAAAACINDLKPRVQAMLDSLKVAPHTWKVVETSAPKNHKLSSATAITKTETGSAAALSFDFLNSPVKMTFNLTKKADGAYGTEATLKGAVYGLYAAETIYRTDNTTVAYTTGKQVATLTTDVNGKAALTGLYPGKYTLKELQASEGFNLDTTVYNVDLSYGNGNVTTTRSLTVTEKRIMGKIAVRKTWDNEDRPYEYVTESHLKADYTPGLCGHHTQHDTSCGYVKAVAGHPCGHVHTDECYTTHLICTDTDPDHAHTNGCYELSCTDTDPGHIHTDDCYKFLDCHHVHDGTCGYVGAVGGQSCTYVCPVCAYEQVTVKQDIEITDSFELYDSKDNLVDTIVIGEDGTGTSKDLPYGTYTLRQKESTRGFAKAATQTVTIDETNQQGTAKYPIQLELDDMLERPGFLITKFRSINDAETGIFRKKAEAGVQFEIYAPDGRYVKTIITDENGMAYSGDLTDFGLGKYKVHQISGESDYMILTDQTINVELKKMYYAEFENTYCGSKLRIQKYRHRTASEPEKGAEFAILDASSITKTVEELSAMTTPEDRTNYVLELQENTPDALISVMTTDENGKAVELFEEWKYKEHPEGFIVFQIKGDEGYTLADAMASDDLTMTVESGIHTFSFKATDEWDDWANITLTKKMTSSATDTVFEENAEFCLRNSQGEVVETKKTDKNGTVRFEKLDYGTYRIEQISGDLRHEFIDPISVTLTRYDKHKDVAASRNPIVDKEKKVEFVLTKKSSETGILLDGARYELYKVVEDGTGRHDEFITTLVSGSATEKNSAGKDVAVKGKAVYDLPYGSYVIREVYPADGYIVDDTEYPFVLDIHSVTYDADGSGSYEVIAEDNPVTGKISLNKKGNIVTSYNDTTHTFDIANAGIPGAVYGLYARENIKKDNGDVVWTAGTLIDRKTTDGSGNITFTRTGKNGQTTDRFYLGHYYVKEISVPAGYTLDTAEYDVYLNWDNKTNQFDDVRKEADVPETEAPVGNNSPDPNAEKYVLAVGQTVNSIVKNATTVTFTWETAPAGATAHNISSDGSNGIVWWNIGTDYYFSTQLSGQVIYFNAISDHMFAGCTDLTDIKFKNVDTSKTVDMSYMFYRCTRLTSLDLSSFNTKNVEDMSCMFEFCSSAQKIYVNDQKLTVDQSFEEDIPVRIVAIPKSEFMIGHTYAVDDFLFYMHYKNGKSEQIYLTAAEAEVTPRVADAAGNHTVQIPFTSNGQYAAFGTIEADVVVIDPRDIDLDLTWTEPEISLALKDEEQQVTIQIKKADYDDDGNETLEGAEFTLYAACDIVDRSGKVILRKDDVIDTQISGGSDFDYVEFMGLPTSAYKKNPADPYMYYVKETKAPEGYNGNDKVVYCSGKASDQKKEEIIFGYTGAGASDEKKEYVGSDDYLYKNQKIPYITLKKEWVGDTPSTRPDRLAVTVTLPDNTKKNYILRPENDWTLITDIDARIFDGRTTSQMLGYFRESSISGYEEIGSSWNKNTNTFTFRNYSRNPVSVTVTKIWSDADNTDGIRPTTVQMALYRNDEYVKTITLPLAGGSWTYTESNLEQTDAEGNPYVYTWKEVATDVINDDPVTGYMSIYKTETTNDGDVTTVTNYHETNTIDKSVQKVWNDSDDRQQIRPDSVDVQLYANDRLVKFKETVDGYVYAGDSERNTLDTVTLNETNSWKATIKDLPLAGDEGNLTYTWKEVMDDAAWITGESVIGYAPEYTQSADNPNETVITNKHVYNTGASVKVNKKVLKDSLSFTVDTPTFTFTLTGQDVYGNDRTFTKSVTFTETDLGSVDTQGYITKSVTFENIPYGVYKVTESGMEGIYRRVSVTADTANAAVDAGGTGADIKIGPSLEEAKQAAGISAAASGE